MTETRDRLLNFLREERSRLADEIERLREERDEVEAIYDLLVVPGVETGAEGHGIADSGPTLDLGLTTSGPTTDSSGPTPRSRNGVGTGGRMKEIYAENRAAIIQTLAPGTWETTQSVSDHTGISRVTVQTHMKTLHDEGRVERHLGQANGGRQPFMYRLLPVVEPREHHIDLKTRLVED